MILQPITINIRNHTAYRFSALRMRALRDSFWAKLSGGDPKLAIYPEHTLRDHPNRKLIGVNDIRVDQIVGTLNRKGDFDNKFRPLGKHLLERWVNTFITLEQDGWSPILVHKIGEQYYVEDGHHRVSVARAVGMMYIQANVWDYTMPAKKIERCCGQVRCADSSPATAYAAG